MRVFLNGALVPRGEATVSVEDRSFLFGDGIYEVVRVIRGRVFEGERHWRRMADGLRGVQIERPALIPDGASLTTLCEQLVREECGAPDEALVYLQVTRGAAPRTHHFPPAGTRPFVYASAAPFAPPVAVRERGAVAILVPDIRWARCDLKTVNLLPNTMAKQQAVMAGADEAIFVRDGVLTEGAATNVLAVVDGVVRTYPASNYILPGVTRDVVLELVTELDQPLRLAPLLLDEVWRAEELFMTSTTNDVMPIVTLDGRAIGTGDPGPVAARLFAALDARQRGMPVVAGAAPSLAARARGGGPTAALR